MKLAKEPFDKISHGQKTIESRLYDTKRRQISIGDELLFRQADNLDKEQNTRVIGLLRYGTFETMFAQHKPGLFGGQSAAQLTEEIHRFYSKDEESELEVVGIHIELV